MNQNPLRETTITRTGHRAKPGRETGPIRDRAARSLVAIAIGIIAAAALGSCVTETAAPPSAAGQGATRVTMEPVRHLEEVMGANTGACRIDAAGICRAYAPAGSAPRSITLAPPGVAAVTVKCQYSGGALSVATAAPESAPDKETAAFLTAHGFCIAH